MRKSLAITGLPRLNLPTVLILSYHFYPSKEIGARRATALARYLADSGIRAVVVSTFDDQPIQSGSQIFPGVIAMPVPRPEKGFLNALVRLKRAVYKRKKEVDTDVRLSDAGLAVERRTRGADRLRDLYFRALYFVDDSKRWAWKASNAAVLASRQYEANLIFASGPPPSSLLAGARAAAKLGVPYVADLRDPWSDHLASTHPNRLFELRLLRLLERWVVRKAAAVTSTGGDVAALLKSRYRDLGTRFHVVRNGYDGSVAVRSCRTGGRLSILFAGELYLGRNPFPVLSGIEWLLAQPEVDAARVDVTFMGRVDAYDGQSLAAWAHGKRCESVLRVLPPQNPQAVAEAVNRSTLLLNLAQQQPLSVPAKTFEQLASGREILLLCEDDCETARVVSGIPGVTQIDPSNFDKLKNFLIDAYTRHVKHNVSAVLTDRDVAQFSRVAANELFLGIFASVAPLGSRSSLGNAESRATRP